jgi:hypothetical protein
MIALRGFAYNLATVVCGVLLLFFAAATLGGWSHERTTDVERVAGVVGSVVLLAATVFLRRHRDRWLRRIAMYESFGAFEARVKESQGAILDVGGILFGQIANSITLDVLRALKDAGATATVLQAYTALKAQRDQGTLGDAACRDAVDALYLAAGGRAGR